VAAPALFRHPASLEHDTGRGHPERVERIMAVEAALAARDWLGFDVRMSPAATRDQLTAVHDPGYVLGIDERSAAGGGRLDADTVLGEGSFAAARHAAGGVVALVDDLIGRPEGELRVGASLHRPPGHHAEPARAMGFCLFNSVAVGARHALDAHGCERVLIVDFDVHHGNGTNDIFHATDEVLFASIHESPLYPGTGPARDVGSGAGTGFTVNLPVPDGSGDETFCSLIDHVVVPLAVAYEPRLVLISAGFDAHRDDPLAGCTVSDAGYAEMAAALRGAADAVGAPLGVVLEGGYDLGALERGVLATLGAISAPEPAPPADRSVHPLAAAARERLAARWPALT
jgi:acetoin utilization deacetylase AcuC-like enzyme